MKDGNFINLRGLNCSAHIEKDFINWYDNIHAPMLLKSGLIRRIRRFRKVSEVQNAPSLLMIYEFKGQEQFAKYEECPELETAKQDTKQRWRNKEFESVWRIQYIQQKFW